MGAQVKNGLGGAGNTVIRGLTTAKEWLMPNPTNPPARVSREPVRLGDALPDVLAEMRRIQREREAR